MSILSEQFKLSIGQVIIQFIAGDGVILQVNEPHSWFLVNEGEPDFSMTVHYDGTLPDLKLEEKLFESGGPWDLYRSKKGYVMTLTAFAINPIPYRAAVIDPEFKNGDLYVRALTRDGDADILEAQRAGQKVSINPTEYPLDEVIMVNLLSRGRGVELHSCGVVVDGHGILFSGVSGAGKSTMANLWKKRGEASILSDDRIIIRKIDGRFLMFGTPWHGDAKTSLAQGAPLEKVFFLKQSPRNYATPLNAIDTTSRLTVRCFPTFYDHSGMLYMVSLLGELAEQIPCYELGFLPDESILDFINEM